MKPLLSFALFFTSAAQLLGDDAVRLQERFPAGYQYHVSSRTDLTGALNPPAEKGKPLPKTVSVRGDSAIEYDERVLDVAPDGTVRKTLRICRRIDFHRTVGDRPQESTIRPAVRRLVLLRRNNQEVPFSPDGPLTWSEIDLVRTDVFTPALTGMLGDREVRIGDRWTATTAAVQELTDMERIDEGRLECKLESVATKEGRRQARVAFSGSVRGANEDGPNRQQLEGHLLFDLESNHVSYLYVKGISSMLDKDGKEVGRVEGRFVLSRTLLDRSPELSDDALKGVTLEPNDSNTMLLFDNPDLGVRLLHPRRWKVAEVRGSQVALAGADGSGILLTVEPPARVPTGVAFATESREVLRGLKARVLRGEEPRTVRANPLLEQFALEAELNGQRLFLDYYVTRQATGGATLAARLTPTDLAALRKEVEGIARSITITRK
jgi:hypothetical protein